MRSVKSFKELLMGWSLYGNATECTYCDAAFPLPSKRQQLITAHWAQQNMTMSSMSHLREQGPISDTHMSKPDTKQQVFIAGVKSQLATMRYDLNDDPPRAGSQEHEIRDQSVAVAVGTMRTNLSDCVPLPVHMTFTPDFEIMTEPRRMIINNSHSPPQGKCFSFFSTKEHSWVQFGTEHILMILINSEQTAIYGKKQTKKEILYIFCCFPCFFSSMMSCYLRSRRGQAAPPTRNWYSHQ